MDIFIKGIGCVSPIKNNHLNDLSEICSPISENGYFKSSEPDYKKYIDPMVSRRMSRVVKMGIFSAKSCLEDAQVEIPDAIVTGTGLGCIEDTEKFLITMIKNDEKFLNPTPFIQSTHNTVSSQISLHLKCHAYNVTYSHSGLSFESALLDSLLLLKEKMADNVLLGGIDEITQNSFNIQARFGLWKKNITNNFNLLQSNSKGGVAGEGSVFFYLNTLPDKANYARLIALKTINSPQNSLSINEEAQLFLKENNIDRHEIDLILLGYNGDCVTDKLYDNLRSATFNQTACAYFKHLCGDYQTATSFAMALSASLIKTQTLPDIMSLNCKPVKQIKNVLIYNHFHNINHSFLLLRNNEL